MEMPHIFIEGFVLNARFQNAWILPFDFLEVYPVMEVKAWLTHVILLSQSVIITPSVLFSIHWRKALISSHIVFLVISS